MNVKIGPTGTKTPTERPLGAPNTSPRRPQNVLSAIFSGKKQLALSLISVATKGEVSGADQHGKTPLHFAAEKGLDDVLMALIVDKRVDVHAH